jgi:hypothetical protein
LLTGSASVAGVAAFAAVGIKSAGVYTPYVVAMSVLSGLVLVGSFWAHARLRRRIGAVTAVLAMALIGGALFLAAAALTPQCFDSAAVGRCTGPELANWGMVGMLVPVAAAVLLGVPVVIGRSGYRFTRFLARTWKGAGTEGPPKPQRSLLQHFRPQSPERPPRKPKHS